MLRVIVEDTARPLEQVVDADIKAFEKWFMQHLQNGEPLVRSEVAILKTYLRFKTRDEGPGPKGDSDATSGG